MTREELIAGIKDLMDSHAVVAAIMSMVDEYTDGCCQSCDGHSCDDTPAWTPKGERGI